MTKVRGRSRDRVQPISSRLSRPEFRPARWLLKSGDFFHEKFSKSKLFSKSKFFFSLFFFLLMSVAYMGAPSRTAPWRGPELVSSRRDPASRICVFYANFGKVRRPAALTGRAPDHMDRCWVRLLSCAKVLTESDQAFGWEGRIADPHRQEPDVIGNPTTTRMGSGPAL